MEQTITNEENYLQLKQEVLNLIMEDIAKDRILSISDNVLDKIINLISSKRDAEIKELIKQRDFHLDKSVEFDKEIRKLKSKRLK